MNRRLRFSILVVLLVSLYYVLSITVFSPAVSGAKTTLVIEGPFVIWSSYVCRLDARTEHLVLSRFRGSATVTDLAPDGARVAKGDLLVRFDSSSLEREVLRLERDRALAKSKLENLSRAKIPIELRELQIGLLEADSTLRAERQYADALSRFLKEGIVSEPEVIQHQAKVNEAETKLATIQLQLRLTEEHKNPAELKGAEATLASAEQELKLAREQLANTAILAPSEGVVVHKSVHMGDGFRTVRVGDSVYPNLPFMALPDMGDMVVHCDVPEEELSQVREGMKASLELLAYTGTKFRGVVETVGAMAHNRPDQSGGKKFFHVVIGFKQTDSRLKPGMSITANILSRSTPHAIMVPRVAVRWEDDKPFVSVLEGPTPEVRQPMLGQANWEYFEVLSGLRPGVKVILQ